MNTSPQTGRPARNSGLSGLLWRLAAARHRSAVQALQLHAPEALEQIVAQADARLVPEFAGEVERLLNVPGALPLRHADTLMPLMRKRFGVSQAQVDTLNVEARRGLRKTCNACGSAGRCWRAMRGGESTETCRSFCPNAAVFDGLAAG